MNVKIMVAHDGKTLAFSLFGGKELCHYEEVTFEYGGMYGLPSRLSKARFEFFTASEKYCMCEKTFKASLDFPYDKFCKLMHEFIIQSMWAVGYANRWVEKVPESWDDSIIFLPKRGFHSPYEEFVSLMNMMVRALNGRTVQIPLKK